MLASDLCMAILELCHLEIGHLGIAKYAHNNVSTITMQQKQYIGVGGGGGSAQRT